MRLSVVIAALNDNAELKATLDSLFATAKTDVEVIVVDDCSANPVRYQHDNVYVHRNNPRLGCAPSRHLGAELSSGDVVLFTDSHMRFTDGWDTGALERLKGRPNTILCGSCLGLDEKNMDVTKPAGVYSGATLNFYGPDRHNTQRKQVFEGVWKDHKDDEEIACLMGAVYFVPRELFFRIGGLSELKMWGSDEPYLSVKAWRSGAEIRVARNVRVGHKFRAAAPYRTEEWPMIFNKIRALMMVCPENEARFLVSRLRELTNPAVFKDAEKWIQHERRFIVSHYNYYQQIFKRSLREYCERFDIVYPTP